MRIEEEIKLDYSDVLFRPKRSALKSRREVNLKRKYKFKHSQLTWEGIPIIASNMDGVGEIGIASKLASFNMMTALTKQHDIKEINILQKIFLSNSSYPGKVLKSGYVSAWNSKSKIKPTPILKTLKTEKRTLQNIFILVFIIISKPYFLNFGF